MVGHSHHGEEKAGEAARTYYVYAGTTRFLRVCCGKQEGRWPQPLPPGVPWKYDWLTPLLLLFWAAQLSPSPAPCTGWCWRRRAQSCVCQPQMPAAVQSWDNCSYLFLFFSRPRRVFQERTFHCMMTCKSSPSIYISNSKSAVSKFEPGLWRIMGQMQLAAHRAACCRLIYFFAHQIPRILVLKSN